MRPYGFDEVEQLRYARAHAQMLREDWRLANSPGSSQIAGGQRRGAFERARRGVGRALIELGWRLVPAEIGSPRLGLAARRPDWGC